MLILGKADYVLILGKVDTTSNFNTENMLFYDISLYRPTAGLPKDKNFGDISTIQRQQRSVLPNLPKLTEPRTKPKFAIAWQFLHWSHKILQVEHPQAWL